MGVTASDGKLYVFGGDAGNWGAHTYKQDLLLLSLDCTPDNAAECISCIETGLSGNAPGSIHTAASSLETAVRSSTATGSMSTSARQALFSTPLPGQSSVSVELSDATTVAQTPAPTSKQLEQQTPFPTFWQLEVWTTMEGLTTADFGTTARNTFKGELSNMFATSAIAESDITIVHVSDTTNRRKLLAVGIQVNYLIGGFPSTSEAGTAARRIEQAETQTYLAVVLRLTPDYINLTSLVSKVSGWSPQTNRPLDTPPADTASDTMDPAGEGDNDTGGSSGSLPFGAIVGGSFGALLLLAAAGCFCCVAARGREAQSPVNQVSNSEACLIANGVVPSSELDVQRAHPDGFVISAFPSEAVRCTAGSDQSGCSAIPSLSRIICILVFFCQREDTAVSAWRWPALQHLDDRSRGVRKPVKRCHSGIVGWPLKN
eukprot:3152248-Rhodomonas_salina.1